MPPPFSRTLLRMPAYHLSRINASETKQSIPSRLAATTPHRNTAYSARGKAERSRSAAQARTTKGCQPTMRNAAVCRTFCLPQRWTNNQSSPALLSNIRLQVMSGSWSRAGSRAAPRHWALGWSAVAQYMRRTGDKSDAGTGVAVQLCYKEGALGQP